MAADPGSVDEAPATERPEGRATSPVLLGLGVGFAVGATAFAIGLSIVALPLMFLASVLEPGGRIDHPFLRTGILGWALPVGLVLGIVSGTAIGVWAARGGRLPDDDRPGWLR